MLGWIVMVILVGLVAELGYDRIRRMRRQRRRLAEMRANVHRRLVSVEDLHWAKGKDEKAS